MELSIAARVLKWATKAIEPSEPVAVSTQEAVDEYLGKAMGIASVEQFELENR